jgi:hypothetical protein
MTAGESKDMHHEIPFTLGVDTVGGVASTVTRVEVEVVALVTLSVATASIR